MLLAISLTAPATWLLDLLCRFQPPESKDSLNLRSSFVAGCISEKEVPQAAAPAEGCGLGRAGEGHRRRTVPAQVCPCSLPVLCLLFDIHSSTPSQLSEKRESFVFCCSTGLLLRDSAAGCLRGPRVEWPHRLHVHCVGSKLFRAWPPPAHARRQKLHRWLSALQITLCGCTFKPCRA